MRVEGFLNFQTSACRGTPQEFQRRKEVRKFLSEQPVLNREVEITYYISSNRRGHNGTTKTVRGFCRVVPTTSRPHKPEALHIQDTVPHYVAISDVISIRVFAPTVPRCFKQETKICATIQ
jgi:hypothetical protein